MAKVIKHRMRYRPGDFKVRSDESGLTVMNSQCKVQWDGLKVASNEFDVKHPQLIIYPKQEKIAVDNPRPTPESDSDLPFGEGDASEL